MRPAWMIKTKTKMTKTKLNSFDFSQELHQLNLQPTHQPNHPRPAHLSPKHPLKNQTQLDQLRNQNHKENSLEEVWLLTH